MPRHLTLFEHDLLFRENPRYGAAMDRVSSADFDALQALVAGGVDDEHEEVFDDGGDRVPYTQLFRLRNAKGELALQFRNFAGVIETPSGLQIEVLPKVDGDVGKARATLMRMLRAAGRIPPITADPASLRPVGLPLVEFFARQFLDAVTHLLKRGLLSGYERVQRNERFLKGRLLVARQLRHNLVRADRFYTEYDRFLLSRAENRLIRRALEVVAAMVAEPANQRLCRELLFAFDDVPASAEIQADFDRCIKDRSLAHYDDALLWARLVLLRMQPLGASGKARVRALLFPMERLFEECVGVGLRKHYGPQATVLPQLRRHCLVTHNGKAYFQLRPDYLLEQGGNPRWVVDAKWKLLDARPSAGVKKYGLPQADLYQLYAYGHKYLRADSGDRTLFLVYPRTEAFREPLAPFEYEPGHVLHVIPFDLERFELVGMREREGHAMSRG